MLTDLTYLRTLRRLEIDALAGELPPASRVLDLGAGTGAQARYLTELGHRVEAIDVASSSYLDHAEFAVQVYDGETIPFPEDHFDVVFSSNVLEHVVGLDELLRETRRVLRPGGRAIHVLPTASWRLWTSLAHYPWLFTFRWCRPGRSGTTSPASARRRWWQSLRLALAAPRHGEEGTALGELYRFSRFHWRRRFRQAGFAPVRYFPNRLFYTGYMVSGPRLSIARRRRLSRFLGSATMTYVLGPPE